MWDPIVSVPDHCLSFYLVSNMTPTFTKEILIAAIRLPQVI